MPNNNFLLTSEAFYVPGEGWRIKTSIPEWLKNNLRDELSRGTGQMSVIITDDNAIEINAEKLV